MPNLMPPTLLTDALAASHRGLLAAVRLLLPATEHAEYCESCADDGYGSRLRDLHRRLEAARTAIRNAETLQ